ncbi:hypothetical protein BDP27DRAFT_310268 [Rhodocollybia butyracea]|uniref:Uncharacterized protein n=1 Tax=Rhodocollybia butyracea TaxID=206335 RepID=A0A9P5PFT2_9AGAR|nr:hypothetical protein BDP27DRAFT_310268 [Rhodocollybia butyracea]
MRKIKTSYDQYLYPSRNSGACIKSNPRRLDITGHCSCPISHTESLHETKTKKARSKEETNSLCIAASISNNGPPSACPFPFPIPCILVANKAALAAAAKPLRPTPAIPASPPDLVSSSGGLGWPKFDEGGNTFCDGRVGGTRESDGGSKRPAGPLPGDIGACGVFIRFMDAVAALLNAESGDMPLRESGTRGESGMRKESGMRGEFSTRGEVWYARRVWYASRVRYTRSRRIITRYRNHSFSRTNSGVWYTGRLWYTRNCRIITRDRNHSFSRTNSGNRHSNIRSRFFFGLVQKRFRKRTRMLLKT